MKKGWAGEPYRHELAKKGIKSKKNKFNTLKEKPQTNYKYRVYIYYNQEIDLLLYEGNDWKKALKTYNDFVDLSIKENYNEEVFIIDEDGFDIKKYIPKKEK